MVTYNVVVKYIIINPIHNWRIHIHLYTSSLLFNKLFMYFFYILKTNEFKFLLEKRKKKNPDEIGNQSKHV